jgi:hypothetical protein
VTVVAAAARDERAGAQHDGEEGTAWHGGGGYETHSGATTSTGILNPAFT